MISAWVFLPKYLVPRASLLRELSIGGYISGRGGIPGAQGGQTVKVASSPYIYSHGDNGGRFHAG